MDNVDLRTQSAYDELNTEFKQTTLSAKHNFGDRCVVGAVMGFADSTFTQPVSTIITFDRANSQGYAYDFRTRAAPRGSRWASTRPTRPTGRPSTARRKSASARPSSRTSSRPPRSMASGKPTRT
jgi:hypothetical protein